jgi:hypothetical protein
MYQLRLWLEEHRPDIVCIKGIHNTIADAFLQLEHDPSVNQTTESYVMTKVNENSKCSQRQTAWQSQNNGAKLKIDTNKTWKFKSCVCKSRKGGQNIPSDYKEIAKAQKQNEDQQFKIYIKTCKNTKKRFAF